MFIELTLTAPDGADYSARDLGFLLHKNPDNVHAREVNAGKAFVFFTDASDQTASAVLHVAVDPVGLVRGRNKDAEGLLDQYVNDRPYVANSFLSVAIGRAFGQSMSGRSKQRQALAERALPFVVRVTPVAVAGGREMVETVFAPLGYAIDIGVLDETTDRAILDLTLTGEVVLKDLLAHLYVLVPVLDNDKHYYIARDEVEVLLAKGEGWLGHHPAKDLIAKRALKNRRALVNATLARLADEAVTPDEADEVAAAEIAEGAETGASMSAVGDISPPDGAADDAGVPDPAERKRPLTAEETFEKPIRLHDLRLDTVAQVLKDQHVASVLDLGCGEGKLIRRLMKERGFKRIVGVDPSVRTLELASRRLRLLAAGEAVRRRVSLLFGSLTYGDRRWEGFDAAALVEVIEHIDPPRLSALERSLFGLARPRVVIVTTPNREYNALFETMPADKLRHPDHRFEWTRAEFEDWAQGVCHRNGYRVSFSPLGPVDETHGAPSQMAVFELGIAETTRAGDVGEAAQTAGAAE